jgi:hypothetical protein
MVDGSHKTTALTLNHKKIHTMVLEKDEDMEEVKALIKTGEVFGIYKLSTIKEELKEKAKHFETAKFFESVEEFNGNFRAKLFLKLKFEDLVSEKLLKKK